MSDGIVQRGTAAPRAPASSGVLPEELTLADHPARLFVCARCRVQVLLCSRCDRGQRYCGRACSRAARRQSLCAAASRYQRSWGGRIAHAARSRRWRQRCRQRARDEAAAVDDTAFDGGVIDLWDDGGTWRWREIGCGVIAAADPTAFVDGGNAAVSFRAADGTIQVARLAGDAWTCERAT